tara:strand:- start:248 stop:586 length:339 start_codon:yes stop_codon:yes gene_type:complete
MSKLALALLFSVIANVIAWFHMNAQFKWEFARSQWYIILAGIPVSYMFYYSTKYFYEHFQQYWTVRPIGFGIATITFAIMTALMLGEVPTPRIIISLILGCIILYINLSPHL